MSRIELGAAVAAIVAIFGAGVAWKGLDARVGKVEERIGLVEKTNATIACAKILDRQLAALTRDRKAVRDEIAGLAQAYGCPRVNAAGSAWDQDAMNAVDANAQTEGPLEQRLESIDNQLAAPGEAH